MSFAADTTVTIIPSLRYRDAPAAIEWLCRAFGFEKHAVHAEGAIVHHAQLTFGNGMIMLSSIDKGNVWDTRLVQPEDIGGRETQAATVIVADADVHYARAKAAGAVIIDELEAKDYGGKGYSCRDLESHIWWFGTYDPWKGTGQA
jgi:uncharacterized glyoxalase superfamily protein PhnB